MERTVEQRLATLEAEVAELRQKVFPQPVPKRQLTEEEQAAEHDKQADSSARHFSKVMHW